MVAITRSNDYHARIVRDIMDTANSFIYLVYIYGNTNLII